MTMCILEYQKTYSVYQLLTYNHYLKVLWLCVSIAVCTLECCPVLLLLLNVLLFLSSIGLLSVCALVVPLRCVSDSCGRSCCLGLRYVVSCYQRGRVFPRLVVLLCCVGGFVPLILICNYHKHGISCE
jgi:hypothetical protein